MISGKICAIKQSKDQFANFKDREQKEKEISNLFKINENKFKYLKNSYCIQLYEAWEENGYLYSSMEYCENGNLKSWMLDRKPFTEDELWKIFM